MTLQQQQKNKNKRRRTEDKRCRFKNILTNLDSKIFFSTFSLLKNIDMIQATAAARDNIKQPGIPKIQE